MISSLNETTFEETLTQCGQHTKYEAVIVLPVMAEVRGLADELNRVHTLKPIPHLRDIIARSHHALMRFGNGSSIEITTPETMRNGDMYHTVLVSEDIDDPRFLDIVYRFEKRYEPDAIRDVAYMFSTTLNNPVWRREYNCNWVKAEVKMADPMDNVTDTAELDNFLNEFAVKS